MQANRFDGSPSTLFLTLFIFYHCTDTGIGGDNVASEVLYMPGSGLATCSLFKIVFKYVKGNKKAIRGHKCVMFWYDHLKSLV